MEFLSGVPAGGTLFNVAAIALGGSLGLALGRFIPERLNDTIFHCIGLFTLCLGVGMGLKMQDAVAVLASLVLGALIGDWLRLDDRLNGLGDLLKARFHLAEGPFTQGFVTATLLFCIGSMAIIGAIDDGLRHDPTLLVTKGVIDGVASVFLAGSLGPGVLFSVLPIALYQVGLTLLAVHMAPFLTERLYTNLSALGGLMILGIGLNLLGLTKLKLCDLLPGLALVVLITVLL